MRGYVGIAAPEGLPVAGRLPRLAKPSAPPKRVMTICEPLAAIAGASNDVAGGTAAARCRTAQRAQITLCHRLWLWCVCFDARLAGRKLPVYWGKTGWVAGAG
jgi:hypothetical protein